MKASPQTVAMLRTTTATTIFHAGIKENVLPINATAAVNFRILQGETVASTIQRVREVIDDDRVHIREISDFFDPSPVSDPYSKEFRLINKSILQTWGSPDLKVAPNLVIGGSDFKHFVELSKNIFRLTALRIESIADANRWHGTNERVLIKEYGNSISFFQQLIRNTEEM
jgi:carboxypeptidase PM20D1